MDISFVIPAKNESKYLPKCLESIKNAIKKSKLSSEIILIDNYSTDNTAEIGKEYGCIVCNCNKPTIAGLRNDGARLANGNYLAFIDADCKIDSSWILLCLENLEGDAVGVTGTRAIPSKELGNWVSWAWYFLAAGSERGDYVSWLGTSNLLISRDLFWKIGGFAEDLQTAEDVDFCSRLNKTHQIYLEKRINTVHLREPSSLPSLFRKEFWRGRSSLRCFIKNGYKINELWSVLVPLTIGGAVLFAFLGFFLKKSIFMLFLVAQLLFFPIVLMIKKGVAFHSIQQIASTYLVALTFILARSMSIYYELFSIFFIRK